MSVRRQRLEELISEIEDIKEEMHSVQSKLLEAKEELMKEMEEHRLTYYCGDDGKAYIRDYSVTRYNKPVVDVVISKLQRKEDIMPEDMNDLSKSTRTKFVMVKGWS